ncbi:hypothetical protein ACVBEQ_03580 [Nakamurella sp. GG22]
MRRFESCRGHSPKAQVKGTSWNSGTVPFSGGATDAEPPADPHSPPFSNDRYRSAPAVSGLAHDGALAATGTAAETTV